jgi:hypothetical protein
MIIATDVSTFSLFKRQGPLSYKVWGREAFGQAKNAMSGLDRDPLH